MRMYGLAVLLALMVGSCAASDESLSTVALDATTPTVASSPTVVSAPDTAVDTITTTVAPTPTTAASTTTAPAPPLSITDPGHGQTITTPTYLFQGMTDPRGSVTVGGKYTATVQDDGTWTLSLQMGPGRNSTTFVATDPDTGLQTEAAIRVYYAEPPGYKGKILRVVWHVDHEGNSQREYYLDQQPTGYFSGSRMPLRWSADAVDRSVAIASRDGTIPLQAFDAEFDGLVMLLQPAGRDQYLVLDEQPVMIAKGAAVLTAACPTNDIPHIVTLSLTQDGLAPTQAWAIDLDAGNLTQANVEALDCSAFEARPIGDDGIGAITTQLRCAFGTECDHRIYDVSTGNLAPMDYWSYGGRILGGDLYYSVHAFGHVSRTPFDPASPGSARVWLKEEIAKDWTGRTIWRVLDATPQTDLSAHFDCWVTTNDDHAPAVAEVDPNDRHIVRAWAVSTDRSHFVEVDPNTVQCQGEEGD